MRMLMFGGRLFGTGTEPTGGTRRLGGVPVVLVVCGFGLVVVTGGLVVVFVGGRLGVV